MKNRTAAGLIRMALCTSLLLPLGGCGAKDPESRGSVEDAVPGDTETKDGETTPTEAIPTMSDGDGTIQQSPDAAFDLYRELSDWSFTFSSGAGGWATSLYFEPDGSFHGDYHDSEMGSTGPGYDFGTVYTCNFTGTCNDYAKISDGIYRLHIDSLEYAPANVETIEDGVRYITADPYGLEDTDELIVYLPGVPLSQLDDGFMDWIGVQHFSQNVGESFAWYEDYPEELPFVGIYNPAQDGYGFSSFPDCDHNKMCLRNMAKMPGVTNRELTIRDDGTYYCEDRDDNGYITIKSACIPLNDSFPQPYEDLEGLITKCIKALPGQPSPVDLYAPDDEYMDPALTYISGEPIRYAYWEEGSNEDTRWCGGIFHFDYIYGADGSTSNGYAQMYMFSVDSDSDMVHNEFMNAYLHSLAYSGSFEGLSSESPDTGKRWSIVYVSGGDGNGGILADLVVWINGDDIDTLKEYGIDPDDVCNDYAIGGYDGDYRSFRLSPDCPIYFRFTDNIFHRYQSYDEFCDTMAESGYDRLFYLLLDKDENVVAMYEPYTP